MSLEGGRKAKRLHEGGVGLALFPLMGPLRHKKRRPFRGVGPEMLSPAGLVNTIMNMAPGTVKPTYQYRTTQSPVRPRRHKTLILLIPTPGRGG